MTDEFVIQADVITDDRQAEADFDAAPYFADPNTTDADLLELARCGFRGDYPADNVARAVADPFRGYYDPNVGGVFEYHDELAGTAAETGFECHVDAEAALAWIAQNRPQIEAEARTAAALRV